MLRDKNLIPLSHQHQHALALCVRIDRALKAGAVVLEPWQTEIEQLFQNEIRYHFEAEETMLFPAAENCDNLGMLVGELRMEHQALRRYAARAATRELTVAELEIFAKTLSHHIRREERRLFEELQRQLPTRQLTRLGAALEGYFRDSGMPGASCAVGPR